MTRNMNQPELDAYNKDGVALLRNAVDAEWITRMNQVIDQQLAAPSKWGNDANPGATVNRHFSDRYQWQNNTEINAYIHESGCARLAAQAMDSKSARFYFDHLLVKEPGTANPTPWHQDVPYWPFLGSQICSIWLALTPCDVSSSAMEFVRGSHLDGKYYQAEAFTGENDANASWMGTAQHEKCPDIANNRDDFDLIGFDMEPGDAVIFSAWTLHGAGGNASLDTRRAAISTRWLGDNAIWHPHPGADPIVGPDDVSVKPGEAPHDDKVFPEIYTG
jgi:ectoine hydroxylase-related dioxygenase (phytanoyl-CoA dioxygenase family)